MDQDWQDTLLTQKRIPHRLAKSQSKASTFDVKKLFGRYQVTCPAAKPSISSGKKKSHEASLEMYRLSDDGQGVLGEIHLPGVLTSEVVMSGSRKSLARVISKLEMNPEVNPEINSKSDDKDEAEDESGSDTSESEDETHTESRPTFEKNSFRNPKFWLNFKSPTSSSDTGSGYLVFSGNDCRRFKGTLSSEMRGWDNIALTGWKAVGMSERDVPFHWGQGGAEDD